LSGIELDIALNTWSATKRGREGRKRERTGKNER
jgi:hypothetical protein